MRDCEVLVHVYRTRVHCVLEYGYSTGATYTRTYSVRINTAVPVVRYPSGSGIATLVLQSAIGSAIAIYMSMDVSRLQHNKHYSMVPAPVLSIPVSIIKRHTGTSTRVHVYTCTGILEYSVYLASLYQSTRVPYTCPQQ